MQTIHILDDLPLRMVRDLQNALTAEKAEMVFHAWRDKGLFVPAKCRARVWCDAIIKQGPPNTAPIGSMWD